MKINHINYVDSNNQIYCRLRNRVVEFNQTQQRDFCSSCPMFRGTAQGEGVECEWEDIRNLKSPHQVFNPSLEYANIITAEAKAGK